MRLNLIQQVEGKPLGFPSTILHSIKGTCDFCIISFF